jgi:cysteinyl-tRNA synthetase
MITFGADKMSKSLGNVLSIAEVTERAPGEALRLLYFGAHYRGPLEFTPQRLDEATRSLERLYEALARADELLGSTAPPALDGALATPDSPFLESFCTAMDEDLNAATALGFVFDRMRELNRAIDAGDRATAGAARSDLRRAGAALGLFAETPATFLDAARRRGQQRTGLTDAEIEAAIAEREEARKRKDFRAADAVRERLRERGILLEDTPSGTLWRAG